MIIFLAVMLIAGLILAVGWWNEVNKNRELKSQIKSYQAELAERSLPKVKEESQEDERGAFVKVQTARTATPETYRNVFDLDYNGQRVLAHLTFMYANKSSYVRGGHDAERESCFRAGQADVLGFIYKQINRANDPDYKEEQVND